MEETNWSLELVRLAPTLILVLVTIYYAVHTHRMANSMKEQSEIERRPMLAFGGITVEVTLTDSLAAQPAKSLGIHVGLNLQNMGKVPISYEVEHIEVTMAGASVSNAGFRNKGGYILPAQNTIFWYPIFRADGLVHVDEGGKVIINAPTGTIEYRIRYRGLGVKRSYVSFRRLEYSVMGRLDGGYHPSTICLEETETECGD